MKCGERYCRILDLVGIRDNELLRAAASVGFVIGQAEKVMLGACQACMVRPLADDEYVWRETLKAVMVSCNEYGLQFINDYKSGEMWIFKPDVETLVIAMLRMEVDSPEYHALRGTLCGISKIDLEFA